MISIIAAVSKNGVIGKKNGIPWYLPADLKHFAKLTTGNSVIMGRKTYESILKKIGKPLPNRQNIIISRNILKAEGCLTVTSFDEAIKNGTSKEIFIIGGGEIYNLALPYVQKLYLTIIDVNIDGDVYFPKIDFNNWKLLRSEKNLKDEKNQYNYTFMTYEKTN